MIGKQYYVMSQVICENCPYLYEGVTQEVGGGRLGVKKCGRWEIGGKKMWEVGDGKTMWRWEIGV